MGRRILRLAVLAALAGFALVPATGQALVAFKAVPKAERPFVAQGPVSQNSHGRFLGVIKSAAKGAGNTSAALGGNLTYHNGPVQHSSVIRAIYWVPPGYYEPSSYQNQITTYFGDVARRSWMTNDVFASTTQYWDGGSPKSFVSYNVTWAGALMDTDALPANGCPNYQLGDNTTSKNCLTDAQLMTEIDNVVASHGWPVGLGEEVFLFTPPGLASCFVSNGLGQGQCYDPSLAADPVGGYCAYHSFDLQATPVLYANQPFAALNGCDAGYRPNGSDADPVLNVASHEESETMTDPLGSAWFDSLGQENGDKCAWTFGTNLGNNGWDVFNQSISHDYELQMEWSNRTGNCVLTNTFVQPKASFTNSASPTHGTPTTFTATASDSDGDTLSYAWDFGDGTTASTATAMHTYTVAGTFSVTLVVTDSNGDQAHVVHTVAVA